ncbi:MAG: PAS domain S-box protein [Proteobacteria bacterium]|nr:PAS domain S-box protein [Pseudomonadota bacterium]MBU1582771.1 PAS domain S-box protein [Pseudomonadota bacterium]MBU2455938.1 PAS domain S-box protein [Pseudomonadota bacterium]MBU2631916.1 PAS domain S-box protein [Pseudomonadota bacterium]
MNKKNSQKKRNQLRSQAEELLKDQSLIKAAADFEDPLKLIHELATYQIELELQNEELNYSQQELMRSQIKYTQLYDFSPVGYISLSLKGMVQNANLTFADMLSTQRRLLIDQPLSAHVVFKDQDIFYRHLRDLFDSKTKQICELRMNNKDGKILEVRLESTVVLDEKEEPVQYLTVVMDICERRQAEEKLRQFKSIVSSSFDLMALIDTNFRYLAVNDTYLNFHGKTRDEIIGHSISEIFNKAFFRETIKPNAENCMAGYNVRYSTWFEFPTMGRRYLDVEYSPYKSADKKIKGFVVNARDSTDLKQSQTLLERNRLQLETVLNNIDLSIYITDLKSNKILFMNKHLKQYYNEDLIGKVCWKSFHENQDGPCEYCANEKLTVADGKPKAPNITQIYNQNRNKWYEKNDSTIPWIDGTLVHLGITTDITERKKLEEKQKRIKTILEEKVRRRTADLEDMNAALKVLLMKRQEDKDEMEDKIFSNHKLLISPILDNLKKNLSRENDKEMINILESELNNLISPFSKKLSDQMINLTPTEMHVANLIKLGKTNKEISTMLDSSVHTIARHRENIRKKTGLKNKKTNLRSFLLTLN